jgi:hypothetical protein
LSSAHEFAALKEQAHVACVFARNQRGDCAAVNFIGQDIIGRALRAFEMDSAGSAKIDFRKGFVDRCQHHI